MLLVDTGVPDALDAPVLLDALDILEHWNDWTTGTTGATGPPEPLDALELLEHWSYWTHWTYRHYWTTVQEPLVALEQPDLLDATGTTGRTGDW